MSQRSLVCTVNRMKKTVNRMEEEIVDRKLEEVQGQGRKTSMVGQISGWTEMKGSCGQMVGEVAGVCWGRVERSS